MAIRLPLIFTRCLINSACRRAPALRPGPIATPSDFLKTIGRELESKLSFGDWNTFWASDRLQLKKAGLTTQDRRYFLWCKEKWKKGWDVGEFAHEAKGKKKIRGRGPAVQNGKRIRSRRLK